MSNNQITTPEPYGIIYRDGNPVVVYDPYTWVPDALDAIENPTSQEWFRIIAGLFNAFKEGTIAKDDVLQWAAEWTDWNTQQGGKNAWKTTREQLNWFAKVPHHGNKVTLGTLWYLAERHGWKVQVDGEADLAFLHSELETDCQERGTANVS